MSQTKRKAPKWVWLYLVALVGLLIYGVLVPRFLPLVDSNFPSDERLAYENFAPGWAEKNPARTVLSPWLRWDTVWYLDIAKNGYQIGGVNVAYPFVYPLLIRLVGGLLGGQYLLASLLISWGAFLGACYLLDAWGKDHEGVLSSSKAVRNMIFFPTAFFFFAGYIESLFLLLVLLAWRQADKKQWLFAGLIGAAATLSKFVGIFLVLPFGVMWLRDFLETKKPWSVLTLAPIPLAYFGWVQAAKALYGITPSEALHQGWALHFDWPWIGLAGSIQKLLRGPVSDTLYIYFDLITVAIVLVSLVWWLKQKRFEIGVFIVSILLVSMMKIADVGILGSTARYMLPLFPVYYTRLPILEKKPYNIIVLVFSIAMWLLGAALFFTYNWLA